LLKSERPQADTENEFRAQRFIPSANRSKRCSAPRSTIGEYNLAGQYQLTPAPAGGGMVKEAWFRRYRPEERPASFDQIVQSDVIDPPPNSRNFQI
jgi:hypothetical protein